MSSHLWIKYFVCHYYHPFNQSSNQAWWLQYKQHCYNQSPASTNPAAQKNRTRITQLLVQRVFQSQTWQQRMLFDGVMKRLVIHSVWSCFLRRHHQQINTSSMSVKLRERVSLEDLLSWTQVENTHLFLVLPPGRVQRLDECCRVTHKHGEAGRAHDHAEDGEPHVGHADGGVQAVPDAQHVAHGLEQSVGVLLTPSVILYDGEGRKFISVSNIHAAASVWAPSNMLHYCPGWCFHFLVYSTVTGTAVFCTETILFGTSAKNIEKIDQLAETLPFNFTIILAQLKQQVQSLVSFVTRTFF